MSSSLSKKYLLLLVLVHHVLLCHVVAVAVFPGAYPIHRRAPSHIAPPLSPHSIPRRARSSSLLAMPPLLRAVPRPPHAPRCCWGSTDAVAAATRDLCKEMLR